MNFVVNYPETNYPVNIVVNCFELSLDLFIILHTICWGHLSMEGEGSKDSRNCMPNASTAQVGRTKITTERKRSGLTADFADGADGIG